MNVISFVGVFLDIKNMEYKNVDDKDEGAGASATADESTEVA